MALKKKKERTPEQMEIHRQATLRWRYRMIEQGLCTRCGKEKAIEGHQLCPTCSEKSRQERRDAQKRARVMGKCVKCQKRWALPHMRICLECKKYGMKWMEEHADRYTYEARKEYIKAKQDRYRAEGRCINCGRPSDGMSRCPRCREMARTAEKRRRERKKNAEKQNS